MKKSMIFNVFSLVLLVAFLAGCSGLGTSPANSTIKASGTISTDTVQIAPEISGKILEIKVDKGDTVKVGDVLFRLDDAILRAQVNQADAAVKVAQANLDNARQKLTSAQVQYNLSVQNAQIQDQPNHSTAWTATQPSKITLPGWYFEKSEQIAALNAQIAAAQAALNTELKNLDDELKNASNADFVTAEKRLSEAQAAYTIAQQTLDEAKAAKNTTDLVDAAQKNLDSAQSELDAAQSAYNLLLTSDASTRVMESRARVAVAQERRNNTQDALNKLMTGSESLQINSAQAALDQANGSVTQAEAGLVQANAALQLIQVQLDKTTVTAPAGGIVLSRPMNAGEVAPAGATVLEIGSLDKVTLTVYIPEDQFGRIQLAQKAHISVDSFPGKTFEGQVTFIADQAEFTPRNVQTVESRSTTVFKIEITILNPNQDLKPGMPADATFS